MRTRPDDSVPLTINVTDTLVPACDHTFVDLAHTGSRETHPCAANNVPTGFTNVITAAGSAPGLGLVDTQIATASVTVLTPSIQIAKLTGANVYVIGSSAEKLELADVPAVSQGAAMSLMLAGLLSLAFMGFAGLGGSHG